MPISLDQIMGLITRAPPQQYQGGSGSGLREAMGMFQDERKRKQMLGVEQMKEEGRSKRSQQRLDLSGAEFDLKSRQYSDKQEERAAKVWREARLSGDPDKIEAAAQELERIGYKVQRPAGAMKEPLATEGAKTTEAESDARIDDALKSEKVDVEGFTKELLGEAPAGGGSALTLDAAPGWTVSRKDGSTMFSLDENELRAEQERRVRENFAPLKEKARDEWEQRAAAIGEETAIGRLGELPIDKAIAAGEEAYKFEAAGKYKKDRTKTGGGVGGGVSPKLERQLGQDAEDFTQRIIQNVSRDNDPDQLGRAYGELERALNNLRTGDATSKAAAINGLVASYSGKAATEREYNRLAAATGLVADLQGVVGYITSEGRISPEVQKQAEGIILRAMAEAQRRRGAMASQAVNLARTMPSSISPEGREGAIGAVYQYYSGVPYRPNKAGGGKKAPAPKSKKQEAEELF